MRTQQLGGMAVPEPSPADNTAVDQGIAYSEPLWLVLPALVPCDYRKIPPHGKSRDFVMFFT